jgi:hypothetical protein
MPPLRLSWIVLLAASFAHVGVRAEKLQCPIVMTCPRGSSIAEMVGIGDNRVDMQDIEFVSYCWTNAGFTGGEIFGQTHQCKIVFHGNYRKAALKHSPVPVHHKYFWRNGNVRREIFYSNSGDVISDAYFDEDGIRLPIGLRDAKQFPVNGESRFHASQEDDVQFEVEQRDTVRICRDTPEVTFGKAVIEKFLHEKQIQLAYVGVTSHALTIISVPMKVATSNTASFYHFSIDATNCDERATCKLSISSWKLLASIDSGEINLERATNEADDVTSALVQKADEAIAGATVQCHVTTGGGRGFLDPRLGFPFPRW